jgi:hypothetical protein
MNKKLALHLGLSLVVLCGSVALAADSTEAVISEALKPSPIAENLRQLTDEIGGRVPGTAAMEKAVQWSVAALKAAGADSVRAEPFQMPLSWGEGATRMEITSPVQFSVRVVSLAWSPPLQAKGARVVDVGMGSAEEFARAGEFGGAVLLVHSDVLKSWDDLFQEYLRAPGIIERAQRGKAAAIAFTATREHDVLYRHINGSGGELMPVPQLLVAREDALRVARLIAAGKQVTADISMPNKAGPAFTTANVVGELRGSERPEEFVILGGHLDSWDLGTGALDNGCNIALVIDTLRAIKASGTRPRRSIRFILFSGEEQGMFGSLAYAQAHRVELDKAVAVVIFDEGVGKVMGFSLGGRKDVAVRLEPLVAPLSRWSADKLTTDAFVGTDNLDFLLEGIPTLVANQEAGNYLVNYHASSDTYDKVDIAQLKNHVAIAAHVVTAIANAREGIGARQSRAEIEALMRETKLDEQMKLFGLWEEWEKGSRGRAR